MPSERLHPRAGFRSRNVWQSDRSAGCGAVWLRFCLYVKYCKFFSCFLVKQRSVGRRPWGGPSRNLTTGTWNGFRFPPPPKSNDLKDPFFIPKMVGHCRILYFCDLFSGEMSSSRYCGAAISQKDSKWNSCDVCDTISSMRIV
jgi:hypothetical protein